MSDNRDFLEEEAVDTTSAELSETIAEDTELGSETDTDAENDEKNEPKKPFVDALDWVSSLVYAVVAMLVLNLFVFRSITVSGESMNETLQDQDRVISTNFFYTPQRGDIVVVQADRLKPGGAQLYGEAIIKRVIALEGDTIKFDFEEGKVWVNDNLLEEDYIAALTTNKLDKVSGKDYVVPEGCVFVMGDNRNFSTDSRDDSVGYVDKDSIMGKAIFRYFPFDSIGIL